MPEAGVVGDYRRGPVTSIVVTVVVTLVVALHLAAIIDVALMPDWAWRGAADASKRRWIVLLALVPGWAIVYYRSADRREVRAHLFRCGGIEPDWHAEHAPGERPRSLIGGAVAKHGGPAQSIGRAAQPVKRSLQTVQTRPRSSGPNQPSSPTTSRPPAIPPPSDDSRFPPQSNFPSSAEGP